MIIVNFPEGQGSDAWLTEKLGKPSASNASMIVTTKGEPSKSQEGYLDELAAEIIRGQKDDGYRSQCMEVGNLRESESRAFYELHHDVEVTEVGLVYKDERKHFLCSPDALIPASKRGVEFKNVLGKTQSKRLRENRLPTEYFTQVQTSLYVTDYESWDWMSYCPGMKPLIIRVERDEVFIKKFALELEVFCHRLEEIVNQIK